ncbi:unnamed protein product [Parascedosporium putredinis]|uniref:AMP-dependent synthetase/ligase domain-containing protein n=1 Tax=Parascedosporium putredinis TaxID=1442378 RepID=A0A9P1GZI3_9PEZI|nr:unnamed protein product [Parascedosporium putredinis]CAI7990839.1 unnamed protein product [Parascedosporium putredinis]
MCLRREHAISPGVISDALAPINADPFHNGFPTPAWVPQLPDHIPTSTTVGDFILTEDVSWPSISAGTAPLIDGITGTLYSKSVLRERVDSASRGLAARLGWSPSGGSPWSKVIAVYGLNSVDYFVICYAIHRLNGICMPIHSSSTRSEIAVQMNKARCDVIFCGPGTMELAAGLGIAPDRIFTFNDAKNTSAQYTSGTTGTAKLAMLTHYGLITNILQAASFENTVKQGRSEVLTGSMPFSHSYGIIMLSLAVWRNDTYVVFPSFDLQLMLKAVSQHRIKRLCLIPSILAALAANPVLFELYDLSSVTTIVTGGAPIYKELTDKIIGLCPTWTLIHAWGTRLRLVGDDGRDINAYGEAGEILFQSPNLFLGYLGDQNESLRSFDEDCWFRTGDIGSMELSTSRTEHLFIRGRSKEMIKVKVRHPPLPNPDRLLAAPQKRPWGWTYAHPSQTSQGLQVIPTRIEAVLLKYPHIVEAAVIGDDLRDHIEEYIRERLQESHWLYRRITFLPALPKTQSGKVVKGMLTAATAA